MVPVGTRTLLCHCIQITRPSYKLLNSVREAKLPAATEKAIAVRLATCALGGAAIFGTRAVALVIAVRGPADTVAGCQRRAYRTVRAAIPGPTYANVIAVRCISIHVKDATGSKYTTTINNDRAVFVRLVASASDAAPAVGDHTRAGADAEDRNEVKD